MLDPNPLRGDEAFGFTLILGPSAEKKLRRALTISQGDPNVLITGPSSATVYVLLIGLFVLSAFLKRHQARLEALLREESSSPERTSPSSTEESSSTPPSHEEDR